MIKGRPQVYARFYPTTPPQPNWMQRNLNGVNLLIPLPPWMALMSSRTERKRQRTSERASERARERERERERELATCCGGFSAVF